MNGAGGSQGGVTRFFVGLLMMVGGGYLLLNAIHVSNTFSLSTRIFGWGGVGITSGYILIPMLFGIGIIFYNSKNYLGWLLALGSLAALIFGVITSLHFSLGGMSLFELLVILVLLVGGLGLFLASLRDLPEA
jgi:hypothetical protein